LSAQFQEPETQLRRTQVRSTLFELVVATPSLSTFVKALVRAGLGSTLSSTQFSFPNGLTVFAPNNDAFAKVPVDLANKLFTKDVFLPHLKDLLLYHVLATKIISKAGAPFQGKKSLPALNGQRLAVSRFPTAINGNRIVTRNIGASNGVADIIDNVLLPSWVSNCITDRVVAASDLSTLLALVTLAGLGDALTASTAQLTLVAPINSAFAKLPASTLTLLNSPEGKATLTSILLHHVFPDILVSSELTNGLITSTLKVGKKVTVSVTNAGIFLNGKAKVVKANILANNGVMHKIDTVLA
jgi:transforming growth factor-beta-induced protein